MKGNHSKEQATPLARLGIAFILLMKTHESLLQRSWAQAKPMLQQEAPGSRAPTPRERSFAATTAAILLPFFQTQDFPSMPYLSMRSRWKRVPGGVYTEDRVRYREKSSHRVVENDVAE